MDRSLHKTSQRTNQAVRQTAPGAWGTATGFTLIELMIAVAIAGILASLAGPTYTDFLYKARIARTVAELHGLTKELQGFALSAGQYPDTLAQIGRNTLLDPWGNPYQYTRINCDPVDIGYLHQPDRPDGESEGRIIPVTGPSSIHEARVFLAVGYADDQEFIHLVGSKGGGSSGGGSGGGGGGSTCGSGKPRKDHFLHPINSDFDIYSMGKDGDTVAPLTAKKSHDDIIRANDGGFYGLAANF